MRLALVLAAALFLGACAGSPAPGSPADLPPTGNPPMGGPDTTAVRPGLPLAELLDESADDRSVLARLNAPARVETEAVANRHVEGQVDTVRTLVYDGLAVEVYEVAGGPAFLQEVRVTGPGYQTAEGLGVGSTRAEVEAVYLHATSVEGAEVSYERPETPEHPTPITLRVRYEPAPAQAGGDRVAAMTWRFYVD